MNAPALPRLELNHLLGAVAAVLIVLAVWPWVHSPASVQAASASTDQSAAAPALPALPPLARFSAIGERPLFSASRRPAPGEKAVPAGPGIEQRYHLLGIIDTGTSRRALLAEGKRRFVIAEGAGLDGWTVAHIEHERIVLSSSVGEAVLLLQPTPAGEGWTEPAPPPVTRPVAPEKPAPEKPQR